ncbi:FMRFamide receptor-like isoform X2 [Biomphalaria glabrata]|nr:FMRFamide receptor-like isoform X2 [Biomphalaria glabrata]
MPNHSTYVSNVSLDIGGGIVENITRITTAPDYSNELPNFADIADVPYNEVMQLQKFVVPVLCLLGFFGNLTSVTIFMGQTLKKKSCIMYLTTKCLTDTLFLAALLVVWLGDIKVYWFHRHGVCQMIVFITYVCGFLSVWLVVMVTVENYIRICHPHRVHDFCTTGKAQVVLLCLGILAIFCYNFPLWTTHIVIMANNTSRCSLVPKFAHFNEGLTYFDTIVTLVAPSLLVLLFMVCIFSSLLAAYRRNRRMRKLGRQRHIHFFCLSPYGRVTAMLLAVSLTFITLHTPSHAIRLRLIFGEILLQHPEQFLPALRLQRLFELLYYTNFATNCVIYLIFGKTFRDLYRRFHCFCCYKGKLIDMDRDSEFLQYICDSAQREEALCGTTEVEKISVEAIMLTASEVH